MVNVATVYLICQKNGRNLWKNLPPEALNHSFITKEWHFIPAELSHQAVTAVKEEAIF